MKILFLASDLFYTTGGIQVFNQHFIKALTGLGHTVTVVAINDNKASCENSYLFIPSGKFRLLRKPTFILNTLGQIFHFRPELIICGHVNFSWFCSLINKFFSIPYLTITHGVDVWNLNKLKTLGLKNSKEIISVSSFTKNQILEQLPDYLENDIFILPNTFDAQEFNLRPKPKYLMGKLHLEPEDKIILTIARLSKKEKYKGYDKVIIAMQEITKEISNVKYILGGSGDDEGRVKNLIKVNCLEDKVILTGFIPHKELTDYYNLCDVFVMPSRGEGFGIVFLEALACGKPVIAGDQDGSRDALLNGKLGLLVNPDDLNQIAQAIIKIFKGEVDNRLLDGNLLRQSVIEHFGLEQFHQRILELLNSIA